MINGNAKFCLASVITVVVLALFIGTVVLSAAHHLHNVDHSAKCESNLHQIGLAIQLYCDTNRGQYPQTISDESEDPKPTWGTPYQSDSTLGPVGGADPFTTGGPETVDAPDTNPATYASPTGPQDSILLPTAVDVSRK